jgi:hypothetical protein
VANNTATDNQTPKTQRYGLNIGSSLCNRTVVGPGDNFAGNLTRDIRNLGTGTIFRWPVTRAAGAAAAAALLAVDCTQTPAPIPPAPTRLAAFVRCPDIALTAIPPGLTKTDSVVEALHGNHMGYVITYSDRDRRRLLKTFAGVDLLDLLDDLDLVT